MGETRSGETFREPEYAVVSPVGESKTEMLSFAPPITTLRGKRVGLIWCRMRNGDVLAQAFADLLSQRFEGVECVRLRSGTELDWGDYPDKTLGDVVRNAGVDAVIATIGC